MLNPIEFYRDLKDRLAGKIPYGMKRSGSWPSVRKAYLAKFPSCAVCGRTKSLQVHHKKPFHLHPALELDPTNLITLCEAGTNCHLDYGHAGDFKGYNPDVVADAPLWLTKFDRSRSIAAAFERSQDISGLERPGRSEIMDSQPTNLDTLSLGVDKFHSGSLVFTGFTVTPAGSVHVDLTKIAVTAIPNGVRISGNLSAGTGQDATLLIGFHIHASGGVGVAALASIGSALGQHSGAEMSLDVYDADGNNIASAVNYFIGGGNVKASDEAHFDGRNEIDVELGIIVKAAAASGGSAGITQVDQSFHGA